MFLRILPFLFFILSNYIYSQDLSSLSVPDALKENANAVIRLSDTDITISSTKSMNIKKKRIVTIYNEYGLKYIDASEYFDKSTSIKSIEAVFYDAFGKVIKKVKRGDFREAAVSEGSMITDNRILYYTYVPVQYPFTVVYNSEVQTSNTAFIPRWSPVEGLYVSTEKALIAITAKPEAGFKYKAYNFSEGSLKTEDAGNKITLTTENLLAVKGEDYSPSFYKIMPHVLFGLGKFHLEGVDGEAGDWAVFGSWIYNSLLAGTDELPEATIAKVKSLTSDVEDPLAKAKIIYRFVQSKTRYISIQLGIGGWKPMAAKDVDRLGYGDCKALTNYTRALLKAVGVDSYYAVVYGDTNRRDILDDFVSMQGNHVILAIPHNGSLVWLECTDQTVPFGYQGTFTDNRMALLIKPDGGELVRTTVYDVKQNSQISRGSFTVTEKGGIAGNIVVASKGMQYNQKYFLETKPQDELDKFYKTSLSHINNLKINKASLKNNKEETEFIEDITIEAEGYCSQSGNRMMFAVNAFNQASHIPQRYRSRINPFEIARGFYDTDEITINLPAGFEIEASPEDISIIDKFGEYRAEYKMDGPGRMVYKRSLQVNPGYYDSNDYENYRQFREKIARNDNAKLVLVKK